MKLGNSSPDRSQQSGRTSSGPLTLLSGVGVALLLGLAACTASSGPAVTAAPAVSDATTGADYPLYELRTYTTQPGKLDALHARFRNHTRVLFEKHGMKNVAYWTPVETPNTLIYIIAHKDQAAAAASWKAFVADPAWQSVYKASIADGRLVANITSTYMRATDYSASL